MEFWRKQRGHSLTGPAMEGYAIGGWVDFTTITAAGVECPSRQYRGDDPAAFIVSLNLKRRHLTESQRAMVPARLTNMKEGRPSKTASIGAVSDAKAASMLNVGERSVERAKTVQREAVPDLQRAVESGKVSVSAAAVIAKKPAPDQQVIIQTGAFKAAVKEYREASAAVKRAEGLNPVKPSDHAEFRRAAGHKRDASGTSPRTAITRTAEFRHFRPAQRDWSGTIAGRARFRPRDRRAWAFCTLLHIVIAARSGTFAGHKRDGSI